MIANLNNIPNVEDGIEILKTAAIFNGQHLDIGSNPPALGADNEKIYSDIGLNDEEINNLKKEGVI